MSIAGIASTALSSILNAGGNTQNSPNNSSQFQTEFQQMGQDLQAGNLAQAEQDFATLSQNSPSANQSSSGGASSPISQAFSSLSKDLQSGNLSAAQNDYATIQNDFEQQRSSGHMHGHHRHTDGIDQPQVNQNFTSLAQALQSGNLNAAQTAFAALQQALDAFTAASGTSLGNAASGRSQAGAASLSVLA